MKYGKAQSIKDDLLDESTRSELLTDTIRRWGWSSQPIVDRVSYVEADWILSARRSLFADYSGLPSQLIGFSIEYESDSNGLEVPSSLASIESFFISEGWKTKVLTDVDGNFAVYMVEDSEYSVLCGPREFVDIALPYSLEAGKMAFTSFSGEDGTVPSESQEFWIAKWDKYCINMT